MAARKLKFALFPDGTALVGYSKEDEEGGFEVVGDVTDQVEWIRREERKACVEVALNEKYDHYGHFAFMVKEAGDIIAAAIEKRSEPSLKSAPETKS